MHGIQWEAPTIEGPRTRTVSDVPLGDGRTIRIALWYPEGERERVILAAGTGEGEDWVGDASCGLVVPEASLADFVRGLCGALTP